MSKISDCEKLRHEIAKSKQWFALLGSPYRGGGGGVGKISSVKCTLEIYHQEYDGASNYHKISGAVEAELDLVFREAAPALLKKAFENLEEKRIEAARLAVAEHTRLLEESGLTASV
jgi:hypothetical protein